MELDMQTVLLWYLQSPYYQQDMGAVRRLWREPGILGIAGLFIFLSYITLPILTAVQPTYGSPRTATMKLGLASEREKRFLQRALGLSIEHGWQGGISNSRVQAMILRLGQSHLQFLGMQREYINYFSGIVSLSVLRVYRMLGIRIDANTREAYWRYMQQTCSLLGANLGEELAAEELCCTFINAHTQITEEGRLLLRSLQETYPEYVQRSLLVLFPKTLATIECLLAGE